MKAKKKRLTLDLDPAFQRRLKATTALKAVSMRKYCLAAIGRELAQDEANGTSGRPVFFRAERLARRRQEIFRGKPLCGDSADLIREAREIRGAETKQRSERERFRRRGRKLGLPVAG